MPSRPPRPPAAPRPGSVLDRALQAVERIGPQPVAPPEGVAETQQPFAGAEAKPASPSTKRPKS